MNPPTSSFIDQNSRDRVTQEKTGSSPDQPFPKPVEDPDARYGGREDRNFEHLAARAALEIFLHPEGLSNSKEGGQSNASFTVEVLCDLHAQGLSEGILLHES